MEFECRLDSRDPELWLECFNPTFFSNLTSGEHTLEVRALDGAENMDPTPGPLHLDGRPRGRRCDTANITLTAVADGWVDEVNPVENYLFETELGVRSGATGDPAAVPPRAGRRPERPGARPLRPADRRVRLRARVGDAAPVQRLARRDAQRGGGAAGRHLGGEHR